MEDLFKPHASKLRNKGIAEVFFDTGMIEQWGSGIEKMINYCKEAGFRSLFLKSTRASGLSSGKEFSTKIISGNLG